MKPEQVPAHRDRSSLVDLRETSLYREAESLYRAGRQPGTGQISDAAEVSATSTHAVFAGTIVDSLNGFPTTRICWTDLSTGDTRVLTFGPNLDRLPKFSPDGLRIAFLSDRHRSGVFQLYLLDPVSGAAQATPRVDGWVEYLHWSPDGNRILLGVAAHGADISGAQGAVTVQGTAEGVPPWMPDVKAGEGRQGWRSAWLYDLAADRMFSVSPKDLNVWEAVWCGCESIAAVVSPDPGEGAWYSATLRTIELESRKVRDVYSPRFQLGWPAASPSGRYLAVVEATCSDRGIVAGELRIYETASRTLRDVDTRGVDITYAEWRSDQRLILAGHRGFESVIGYYDAKSNTFSEVWASQTITTGGLYISISPLSDTADCVLVGEGFLKAPEIAVIGSGEYRSVRSFDLGYGTQAKVVERVDTICWTAPDGLEMQGWMLRPQGHGPHPLVTYIHGGPVSHWRPMWLGRRSAAILMLLERGYAIFFPNPRGSSGRGQHFASQVLGDVGGADTRDLLSGLDHLVGQRMADPARLGVTGGSYGGFMAAWLITQDNRFAAAVAVAPVTNHLTAHLISNIPHYVRLSLADDFTNLGGKYFTRSPVMYAQQVRTPTLNICGALDRCTPPEEAVQFHNALLESGVESVLVTYPEEGHGVRKWPASIDYAARVVDWFDRHMPAEILDGLVAERES
jgi:dipeptidyl aminopeptidase/acylaminoacyl peptidase